MAAFRLGQNSLGLGSLSLVIAIVAFLFNDFAFGKGTSLGEYLLRPFGLSNISWYVGFRPFYSGMVIGSRHTADLFARAGFILPICLFLVIQHVVSVSFSASFVSGA
ncbi:hypothetical protein G4V62_04195 [Bacillaceae bacterium SIJ1]|uniref:hypothetical protein n=1 Tax=Litoribacterium kuwaitense TaxID=1398745 RepID=UPI0013EBB53F|nr:hypothetical protein [Litoribacterium kuwaitense]NGP44190.1 hypothetical protein [Litoribacterium kuwaitense]